MKDVNFIQENNARHFWLPMAHPREMLEHPPIVITKGQGVEIEDIDGHRVLDGVGGLWCTNLGHSSEPVKEAIAKQLEELPYYNSFRSTTTAPTIELSWMLREYFKEDGLSRCFLTSGGSDSVETALRLARQYHRITGQPERTKYFSLMRGYHGTHFGGASVNGNANFRRNYEPMLPGCFHLPSPFLYRNDYDLTDGEALVARIAAKFESEIEFQGANTIAALIMEPILGAGGVIVPPESLFPVMRKICDKHGILLIADEVITAYGRAGTASGSRLWGVQPDIMTTAKAITNGYFPLGAVMLSDKIGDAFESNTDTRGVISHGYTYSGHPVGAAAAIATLKEISRLNVAENARLRGAQLMAGFQALEQKYELIGNLRGQGLMLALELVSDRASKTPASKGTVATFFTAAYKAGLMTRTSGNNIILSPALIINQADVERILACVEEGLAAASA